MYENNEINSLMNQLAQAGVKHLDCTIDSRPDRAVDQYGRIIKFYRDFRHGQGRKTFRIL